MTQIDFAKGPEGATHYCNDTWYQCNVSHWRYWSPTTLAWQVTPYASPENFSWWSASVSRQDQEWNGSGLPPVGTVCEFMKHNSPPAPEGKWLIGEILYLSRFTVIISGDMCEHVHHPRNCSFRPIRTPAQLAAEEREKAIEFMMQMTSSLGHSDVSKKILFGELYDKGLRFEAKP